MAKKPTTGSIAEELLAHLPTRRRARWEDHLPAEVREELEVIKGDFLAGRYTGVASRTGLAAAISQTLAARGLQGCAHSVARWLDRK
jgi:hypothetical protein